MSLHDLAVAAAELTRQEKLPVFPLPGCTPRDAVDRPDRAYSLFMQHREAEHIGVPAGVTTTIVAICVHAAGLRWLRHNFARFPATRAHWTPRLEPEAGGEVQLIYRMPLPPVPIIGCPQAPRNLLDARGGVAVKGEGGWVLWPAPPPYQDATPSCMVALDVPRAPLPGWIIKRVTAPPRPKEPPVLRLPRRGLDEQRDRIIGFVRYSRQGPHPDVTFAGGHAAGRLVAQGALCEAEAVALVTAAAVEAAWSSSRRGRRRLVE